MMATGPTGFQAQFQEFMFYAGPIVQILFWIIISVAAIWAVLILKRAVDAHARHCCADKPSGVGLKQASPSTISTEDGWSYDEEDAEETGQKAEKPIRVDKFVD